MEVNKLDKQTGMSFLFGTKLSLCSNTVDKMAADGLTFLSLTKKLSIDMISEGAFTGSSVVLVLSSVSADWDDWSGFSFFECLGLTNWISLMVQNVVYTKTILMEPVYFRAWNKYFILDGQMS